MSPRSGRLHRPSHAWTLVVLLAAGCDAQGPPPSDAAEEAECTPPAPVLPPEPPIDAWLETDPECSWVGRWPSIQEFDWGALLIAEAAGCAGERGGVLVYDLASREPLKRATDALEAGEFYDAVIVGDEYGPTHIGARWYPSSFDDIGLVVLDWETGALLYETLHGELSIGSYHVGQANGLFLAGDKDAAFDRGELLVFPPDLSGQVDASDAVAAHHGTRDDGGLGSHFWNVDDLDGDGLDDVLLAYHAPWTVLLGEDLLQDEGIGNAIRLETWPMYANSATAAGDFDGDGGNDIAVGSWVLDEEAEGRRFVGSIRIYSGTETTPYATVLDTREFEPGLAYELGKSLGSIGDADDDGWPTLVSALEAQSPYSENPEYWLVEAPLCGTVELGEVGSRLELGTDEKYGMYFAAGVDTLVLPVFDWDDDLIGDKLLNW